MMRLEEAENLLREYDGYLNKFVYWSGGKDSTVLLYLVRRIWKNFIVIHVDIGIEYPETMEYVRYLAKKWNLNIIILKAQRKFWKTVKEWGFPHVKYLWCRHHFQYKTIKDFYRITDEPIVEAVGVRTAESNRRKKFYTTNVMQSKMNKKAVSIYPVLNWTDDEMQAYREKYRIPVNQCYSIYGRSGCYFCPFVKNKKYYLILKQEHPALWNNIVDAEKSMRSGMKAFPDWSAIELDNQKNSPLKDEMR